MSTRRRALHSERSRHAPFARKLLASASGDHSSEGARERALAALGLGGFGGVGAGAKAAGTKTAVAKGVGAKASVGLAAHATGASVAPAAKAGLPLLAKWLAVGALCALGGGAALVAQNESSPLPLAPAVPVATSTAGGQKPAAGPAVPAGERGKALPLPAQALAAGAGSLAPTREEGAAAASVIGATPRAGARAPIVPAAVPAPGATSASALAVAPPVSADATSSANAAPPPSKLAEQLRALAAVRGALGAGDPRGALAGLDDFDERYAASPLSEEAVVLRIDALADAGRAPEASRLASLFLTTHPTSAYRERVRAKLTLP